MELLWKLCTFHVVIIQWNLLDRPKRKIRKIWFVIIFCFVLSKQNHGMFFLQRNQNTSLNYYDFPDHFSALCFFTEESGKVCVAKDTHCRSFLKINISRKYVLLLFFSEKCNSQCHRSRLVHNGSLQFKHEVCSETFVVL